MHIIPPYKQRWLSRYMYIYILKENQHGCFHMAKTWEGWNVVHIFMYRCINSIKMFLRWWNIMQVFRHIYLNMSTSIHMYMYTDVWFRTWMNMIQYCMYFAHVFTRTGSVLRDQTRICKERWLPPAHPFRPALHPVDYMSSIATAWENHYSNYVIQKVSKTLAKHTFA